MSVLRSWQCDRLTFRENFFCTSENACRPGAWRSSFETDEVSFKTAEYQINRHGRKGGDDYWWRWLMKRMSRNDIAYCTFASLMMEGSPTIITQRCHIPLQSHPFHYLIHYAWALIVKASCPVCGAMGQSSALGQHCNCAPSLSVIQLKGVVRDPKLWFVLGLLAGPAISFWYGWTTEMLHMFCGHPIWGFNHGFRLLSALPQLDLANITIINRSIRGHFRRRQPW